MDPEQVELPRVEPECGMPDCGQQAVALVRGCTDKSATLLCQDCLDRGVKLVQDMIRDLMREYRSIVTCGGCHRPLINLDTHLNVRRLPA